MATLSFLIELANRHEARSVKWKKSGIFYSTTIDGLLLEVNTSVPSCRINKGEWCKLWKGTTASVKTQAIRLMQRAVDAGESVPLEALSTPENSATSQTETTGAQHR